MALEDEKEDDEDEDEEQGLLLESASRSAFNSLKIERWFASMMSLEIGADAC